MADGALQRAARGTVRGPAHNPNIGRDQYTYAQMGSDVADWAVENPLDAAAIATAPIPVVGDAVGGVADLVALIEDPSWTNAGLMAAGLIPFVPAGTVGRVAKTAVAGIPEGGEGSYSAAQILKNLDARMEMNAEVTPRGALKMVRDESLIKHPVGLGKILKIPYNEISFEIAPRDIQVPPKALSIEDMQGGYLIPGIGDRSAATGELLSVNDIVFENPVRLEGGPDFMRTHAPYGEMWASDKTVTTKLGNLAKRANEMGGGPAYLAYSAMGPESLGFNTMLSDALVEQVKLSKITKKTAKKFDSEIKKIDKNWPGIQSDSVRDYLRGKPGTFRTIVAEKMAKDDYADAGFPDVPSTRKAITEQSIIDAPLNSVGYSFAKMDPSGATITDPASRHTTYPVNMKGDYAGQWDVDVPVDVVFRDFFDFRRNNRKPNFNPKKPGDIRAFQMSNIIQPIDQELVDSVMSYQERVKRGY